MRNFLTPKNFVLNYDQFAELVEKEMKKALEEWIKIKIEEKPSVIQMWVKVPIDLITDDIIEKLRHELITEFGWREETIKVKKQPSDRGADHVYIELRLQQQS